MPPSAKQKAARLAGYPGGARRTSGGGRLVRNRWSISPEWVVGIHRNRWTVCSGISGRFAPESVDDLQRNQWSICAGIPSLHVDETSLRVDRKNHWIHVYSAGDITLKRLHPKRGLEAIEDIGIIPRYGGVVIHDCWQSYLSYEHCGHGLCGSHLLRELTFPRCQARCRLSMIVFV